MVVAPRPSVKRQIDQHDQRQHCGPSPRCPVWTQSLWHRTPPRGLQSRDIYSSSRAGICRSSEKSRVKAPMQKQESRPSRQCRTDAAATTLTSGREHHEIPRNYQGCGIPTCTEAIAIQSSTSSRHSERILHESQSAERKAAASSPLKVNPPIDRKARLERRWNDGVQR
jgi:hypothetical protein